jgi:hypothetical protein
MSSRLAGLPPVLPLEAPSSWLTRAALSQGVDFKLLLQFFGIDRQADSDLAFLSDRFPLIAAQCGFLGGEFRCVRRMVESLKALGPRGRRLLLRGERGRARFRICPVCVGEQPTPYLPFHCRFTVWRYCVVHDCMLEDACWKCGAAIELPVTLATGRAAKLECAYISQCIRCGSSLGKAAPVFVDGSPPRLSAIERLLMANGRATLAALVHRRVEFKGHAPLGIAALARLERMGLLGSRGAFPSAEVLRQTHRPTRDQGG